MGSAPSSCIGLSLVWKVGWRGPNYWELHFPPSRILLTSSVKKFRSIMPRPTAKRPCLVRIGFSLIHQI